MGKGGKIFTRDFVLLMVAQACALLTYNMVTPVVAKYASAQGAALGDAGIVAGAFAVVAVVARPVGGALCDRVDRRRALLVSMAASCVALFGYAASTDLVVFTAFRVLHGIAYAVFSTVASAAVLELIPSGRQAEGMGYFSWSYVIASACGPALGVAVSDALGFPAMFACSGAVTLAGTLLLLPLRCLSGKEGVGGRGLRFADFFSVKAAPFMVVIACFSVNWGCISTFLVMTGDERGVAGIAAFFTANAIALLVTRPPAGRFADRHGVAAMFYPAAVFESLAMALLAFAQQLWLFLVIAVLKALGQGTVHPSLQVESVKAESADRSGVAMSTFLMGTDIGYAIGPVYGGFVAAQLGYSGMYLACIPFTVLAAAVFTFWWVSARRSRGGFSSGNAGRAQSSKVDS